MLSLLFGLLIGQLSATLTGTVVDGSTGAALSGAQVSLAPLPNGAIITAVTDASGNFAMTVPSGPYQIWANKDDYASPLLPGSRRIGKAIGIAAGESKQVKLGLERASVLVGSVANARGEAVPNVRIALARYGYDASGNKVLSSIPVVATNNSSDDQGNFRLFELPPGDYYVVASPSATSAPLESYVRTYFPGVGDPAQAALISLRPGEELRLSPFTMLTTKGAIRLKWTNLTGVAAPMAFIELRQNGVALRSLSVSAAPGQYELPALAPGKYEVAVGLQRESNFAFGTVELTVAESPVEADVAVGPGWTITGRTLLRQADGTTQGIGPVQISMGARGSPRGTSRMSTTDGVFAIPAFEGENPVAISALPPDTYLLSARAGNRNVLAEGLRITGDAEMEITLGNHGGSIKGAVVDANGEKIVDAVVVLVPDDPRRLEPQFYRTANTDQRGAFAIRDIAPGAYGLFAWSSLEGAAYRNADFMKPYERRGTSVSITRDASVTVDAPLMK